MSRIYRPSRTAESRFKGVTRSSNKRRWHADVYVQGKCVHIGTFDSEVEAALAYDFAALQHLGPGSYLNLRDGASMHPILVSDVALIPYRRTAQTMSGSMGYFLVDAEDAEKVRPYYWRLSSGTLTAKVERKDVALSVLLCGSAPDSHRIAHVNGDALDNRKANLAAVPVGLYAGRQRKQKRKTKSIYKGVRKAGGRWAAVLASRHLGTFDVEEDAARAYDNAARQRFGIFAAVNFPRANELGCLRKRLANLPLAA